MLSWNFWNAMTSSVIDIETDVRNAHAFDFSDSHVITRPRFWSKKVKSRVCFDALLRPIYNILLLFIAKAIILSGKHLYPG